MPGSAQPWSFDCITRLTCSDAGGMWTTTPLASLVAMVTRKWRPGWTGIDSAHWRASLAHPARGAPPSARCWEPHSRATGKRSSSATWPASRPRTATGVDFRGADLGNADFSSSKVQGASFRGANLRNAVFDFADASGASFRDACLVGTDFFGANLDGASLRGAILCNTIFPGGQIRNGSCGKVDSAVRRAWGSASHADRAVSAAGRFNASAVSAWSA